MHKTEQAETRKPAPLSAHPAFPVLVAVWFAALFGLGSLVLPPALPEYAVALTGIDALVPAMAPPLGFTARILIAIAAAIVGGVGGMALARWIVAAQRSARRQTAAPGPRLRSADRHPDAPARRPISALEELGEDRLPDHQPGATRAADELARLAAEAGLTEWSGRRRNFAGLAEQEPEAPRDEAPLPDSGEFAAQDESRESLEPGADEAASLDATMQEWIESSLPPFDGADAGGAPHIASEPDIAPASLALDAPVLPADPGGNTGDLAEGGHDEAGENPAIRERPLAELGVTELVERLAYAMHDRQSAAIVFGNAESPDEDAPAERRIVWDDEAMAERPASEIANMPTDPQQGFPPVPAALRPVGFDLEEGDAEDAEEADLALSGFGLGALSSYDASDFGEEDEPEEESEEEGEAYSSLLNLNLGIARRAPDEAESGESDETARSREDPAAEQAGQAHIRPEDGANSRPFDPPRSAGADSGADSGATDKALREALARLQRIGGAA